MDPEYLAARYKKRLEILQAGTNVLCVCQKIIKYAEEIDPHLDHLIEADAYERLKNAKH